MLGEAGIKRATYETARLKLAHVRLESGETVSAALALMTQTVADAIEVDRVGIWFLEDQDRELVCRTQFIRGTRKHTSGAVLRAREFPTYLQALKSRRAVVADFAREHVSTRELSDAYLRPNGVESLLDAPIIRRGRVVGVVCHERVGIARAWSQREIDFAGSVGDLVALVLEQGDRVQLEAALKVQAEERLERQKLDALALLARSVAHDLNNVLAVVAGAASEAYGVGQPDMAELLEAAVDAGKRLSAQLRDVGERNSREPAGTDVAKVLRRSLPALRTLATRRVRVELDVRGSELLATISEGNLERAVFNLVANARDAILQLADEGRGRIDIVVRSPSEEDEAAPDCVVIEVCDDGCGMDAHTRVHLFEPYFTTKPDGQGLGLATVYGIVTRAKGSIDVASVLGRGTSFRIVLPAGVKVS